MTINSLKFQPKYFVQLRKYIIKVQIHLSLFCQLCFCSEFAKVFTHQSFPLYGSQSTLFRWSNEKVGYKNVW